MDLNIKCILCNKYHHFTTKIGSPACNVVFFLKEKAWRKRIQGVLELEKSNYFQEFKYFFIGKSRGFVLQSFYEKAFSTLHNARIYRTALTERIWLALCSRVTRKFKALSSIKYGKPENGWYVKAKENKLCLI